MKVVLFCGGRGLRMQEASRRIPKPMVRIGDRPVLWHVMKYFAHFGHNDFLLALGYKQEAIKQYFLDYNEALSNDFVLSGGGVHLTLLGEDISDWRITCVDTGFSSVVGERLRRLRDHLRGEDYFLANYGDVLTDAPLGQLITAAKASGRIATFMSVRPSYTFHTVESDADGRVTGVRSSAESGMWLNGGYFVLRREIFDYMEPGEELVTDVFAKLIAEGQLGTVHYEGFWAPMDTLKEQQALQEMVEAGGGPWRVWDPGALEISRRRGNGNGCPR